MLLRTLPALLLAATSVHALKDASPFLMFSSEPLPHNQLESRQIATAASVESQLLSTLSRCSESLYLLVSQPGLKAADLQDATAMPKMRRRIADGPSDALVEIANVVGAVDVRDVARRLDDKCSVRAYSSSEGDAWETSSVPVSLPLLPTDFSKAGSAKERAAVLQETDNYIDTQLARLEKQGQPYVLVFTSGAVDAPSTRVATEDKHLPYEMDEPYPSALHTDLRRDLEHNKQRRQSNNGTDSSVQVGLPLFETYQFLTPAIFMGLSVSLLLFLILYVGVSAIAGLEVSYMAFSKEMGPSAQNKNKQ
ncbi:hypothetical protein LTR36_002365 [Oleoguttula mirabilis]|uniref:Protein BIG1 n=1 Tax=Oleoguttula mirabilis TaxID=1507867 RepID=A0AAV9JLR6_9PEZI|nr:hypothetical protein LTR36_002365 [Oleoguttula mirabilis]